MSFLLSPPQSPEKDDSGHDGLDNLLRSFYKAEMPNPWPSMEAPGDRRVLPAFNAPPRRRHSLVRSRLALAASVALLLAGAWLLMGGKGPVAGPVSSEETLPAPRHPTADSTHGKPPMPAPPVMPEDWPN